MKNSVYPKISYAIENKISFEKVICFKTAHNNYGFLDQATKEWTVVPMFFHDYAPILHFENSFSNITELNAFLNCFYNDIVIEVFDTTIKLTVGEV